MAAFETLDNRCRVCASELSDLTCSIPIFGESSASFFLQTKISKYLYITVLEDDSLPKKICATCFLKIESIDKFAFSASKNQECFLTWLQNQQNKLDTNLSQTTIETSTNSDFSFSNITIKKEFNQRQQIVFQPHKTRNPRHVDHITLEQIINDQIIKNPKLPASTTITRIDEPKRTRRQFGKTSDGSSNISIVAYNNLQIGQLIKDYELLKLILRALKWEEYDRKASYHELMERLRRSNCRDILTNKNLLSDNDVVQLLRSYMDDSMLVNLKAPFSQNASKVLSPQPVMIVASLPLSPQHSHKSPISAIKTTKIVQEDCCTLGSEAMEVSVDPQIFLADEESITIDDDDEETVSASETKIEHQKLDKLHNDDKTLVIDERDKQIDTEIRNNGVHICASCPESFASNNDLQNHVTTHLINSSVESMNVIEESVIKKKKRREEKLKPRRKKIVIRINPSPRKPLREKSKFLCTICQRALSSKRNLQQHHDTHKDSKTGKFRCDGDGCKKIFGKLENYVKHRHEAHEKPSKRKRNQNEK